MVAAGPPAAAIPRGTEIQAKGNRGVAGQRPRSVVLLSGGMDSGVCAALAARETEAAALHVSYGQRTEARERRAFRQICGRRTIRPRLGLRRQILRLIS